jgi:hypothetical protein
MNPWWENSEAVTALAEFLCEVAWADGSTIMRLYEQPWEFSDDYSAMEAAFIDDVCGDG